MEKEADHRSSFFRICIYADGISGAGEGRKYY